jgi:alpha-amylase
MLSKITIASTALLATSSAAQVDEWKKRAVYQVLTDRFAQDNDGSGACGNLSQYCGGTYKGMINHLDYI